MLRERPNNQQCNLCGEWHKEGIENYVEHLKTCTHKKENSDELLEVNYVTCTGLTYSFGYPVSTVKGLKQVFAMYVKPFAKTEYNRKKLVNFSRVGGLVSLVSFYDLGRVPITLGWGNGRVMWVGQKGSKWFNFRTWGEFRWRVFDRDNGVCQMCGKVLGEKVTDGSCVGLWKNDAVFVCDHIVPLCKDGKDWYENSDMTNFQTLCSDCNKIKTNGDMVSYRKGQLLEKVVGRKGLPLTMF